MLRSIGAARPPDPDVLATFDRDGFTVVRGALPSTSLASLRAAALRLRDSGRLRCRYRGPGKIGYRWLVGHDETFLPLVANPAILPTVVALLSPNIRLLSSHLITYDPVPPGPQRGARTPENPGWHRDDVFHMEGDLGYDNVPRLTVHCAYYLSALGPDGGGPTVFLPGSHTAPGRPSVPPGELDPPGAVTPDLAPGDAVLFENRTWHAAGADGTREPRLAAMFQYGYRWLAPIDDPYPQFLSRCDLPGEIRQLLGQPDRNPDGSMAKRAGARPLHEWWQRLALVSG